MRKTDKGRFTPRHPEKYVGNVEAITYRSSWELTVFNYLDKHPCVITWSSEGQKVPYFNPLTQKWTVYVPDLIVKTIVDGVERVEMIEVKPITQVPGYRPKGKNGKLGKISKHNLAEQIRNEAKWAAARAICAKRGWHFQVMTEQTLFGHTGKDK